MTAMERGTAISLSGVSKRFGAVEAVRAVDLEVGAGEIVAVVGPSGCGKTTLLRLVAGFEVPDAGTIEVAGRVVARAEPGRPAAAAVPPEKRRVGMVFQEHALFPHLDVRSNVAYGLRGLEARAAEERTEEALALVGLAEAGARRPGELSGGEQQRVALARALAPRPEVLLLDEPLASLDAVLRRELRAEVRSILRRAGTAALLVTHDQREALFFGDRVAVMRAGRIEQAGRAEDLFEAPATPFVATFLGGADLLPGRVERGRLRTEVGDLPADGVPPDALEVVVRRDDLEVEADPHGAPEKTARVLDRHFQGTHYLYRIGLPSGRTVRVLAPHTRRLDEGSPVRVRLAPGHPLPAFAGGRPVRVG